MIEQDNVPMQYDPADGMLSPSPSVASHWRTFNSPAAWIYNPWTGDSRDTGDISDDPQGELIEP
ncbi:hypothetical protein D3C85_13540 [compost metagenome]